MWRQTLIQLLTDYVTCYQGDLLLVSRQSEGSSPLPYRTIKVSADSKNNKEMINYWPIFKKINSAIKMTQQESRSRTFSFDQSRRILSQVSYKSSNTSVPALKHQGVNYVPHKRLFFLHIHFEYFTTCFFFLFHSLCYSLLDAQLGVATAFTHLSS